MINIQDLLEEAGVQSWEAERQGCWAQVGRGAGEVLLLQGLPALQAQQPAAQPARDSQENQPWQRLRG